jgi:high-affinity iron transporter
VGQVASADQTAPAVVVGAASGLLVAVLLGVGFYQGSRRLDLARFFRWTGIALVFIAAGLLSHAIHEFVEVGVVAVGTAQAFDISALLPHEGSSPAAIVGSLLRAVFGYTSTPEVVTLVIWAAYIVTVLALYLRPMGPRSGGPHEVTARVA